MKDIIEKSMPHFFFTGQSPKCVTASKKKCFFANMECILQSFNAHKNTLTKYSPLSQEGITSKALSLLISQNHRLQTFAKT